MNAAGNMLVLALISAPFALLSGFGLRISHNSFIIYHQLISCISFQHFGLFFQRSVLSREFANGER